MAPPFTGPTLSDAPGCGAPRFGAGVVISPCAVEPWAVGGGSNSCRTASMRDPRVEIRVQDVDGEVHDDVADGDHQRDALDHEQVTDEHCLQEEAADAREGEERLDDHRAADDR